MNWDSGMPAADDDPGGYWAFYRDVNNCACMNVDQADERSAGSDEEDAEDQDLDDFW